MKIDDLISFLDSSPTAWHATQNLAKALRSNGFHELDEKSPWKLKAGGKFFVVKEGASLAAFVLPKKKWQATQIIASHTDSPALKLKPHCEFQVGNMVLFGAEIYGAPLFSSWLNRDLGIAGQIALQDKIGKILFELVDLRDHPGIIPQLAIHLDREVNEKGLILNPQEHLPVLMALRENTQTKYLDFLLKDTLKGRKLLSHDLFLFPIEKPKLLGKGEMLASWRIDNLAAAAAALTAISKTPPLQHTAQIALFWDHEEIGSKTTRGADSSFLNDLLERLAFLLQLNEEEQQMQKSRSLCTSIDMAHAQNPNYPQKQEPRHSLFMEKGIVVKYSAQNKYASESRSTALLLGLCQKNKIPLQLFVSRTDMPSGSTVGPLNASRTGIKTVDIGLATLSMHATREIMATKDFATLCTLLEALTACEL